MPDSKRTVTEGCSIPKQTRTRLSRAQHVSNLCPTSVDVRYMSDMDMAPPKEFLCIIRFPHVKLRNVIILRNKEYGRPWLIFDVNISDVRNANISKIPTLHFQLFLSNHQTSMLKHQETLLAYNIT